MTEQTKPKSMSKYRQQNRRYDYYPTPDAAKIIEVLRKFNPGATTREVLDALIVKGGKVFFPDEVGTKK